mmetsp:Transcript_3055/g.7093  ORF Transcript_3055/g.7093 Transcript_3055/m.7093 type:complete len:215 (-) Transcript_3055:118-762(-)
MVFLMKTQPMPRKRVCETAVSVTTSHAYTASPSRPCPSLFSPAIVFVLSASPATAALAFAAGRAPPPSPATARVAAPRSIFLYSTCSTSSDSSRASTVIPINMYTECMAIAFTESPSGHTSPSVSPSCCSAPSQVVTGQIPSSPTSSRESQQNGHGEFAQAFASAWTFGSPITLQPGGSALVVPAVPTVTTPVARQLASGCAQSNSFSVSACHA